MNILSKKEFPIYFTGDIFFLVFSLWLTLFLRHLSPPSKEFLAEHLVPFFFLFAAWIFVFYAAGLYEKQTAILRKKLPGRIINAQIANGIISVFFFYFSPYFGITPKTNLLIYFLVSSALIILWRLAAINFLKINRKQSVVVLLSNPEMEEIVKELEENRKYNVENLFLFNLKESQNRTFVESIKKKIGGNVSLVVADLQDEKIQSLIPEFYEFLFSGIIFLDVRKIYEELFGKIPFFSVKENWLLENLYFHKSSYDFIKRIVDIAIALPLSIVSLLFYIPIFLAIKIEDKGPLFVVQERIGQKGKKIKIAKFRSMKVNDSGVWVKNRDERITKVGGFLRKSRLDELPQLWSVIKGDISLIGPRPDIRGLRGELEEKIPCYNARDLVRPGLSGWAQINQEDPPQSVEETRERLMYDFYYIKNRSLGLDAKIALRTLQILISRTGV